MRLRENVGSGDFYAKNNPSLQVMQGRVLLFYGSHIILLSAAVLQHYGR
mgnify:CR=1 FL=1